MAHTIDYIAVRRCNAFVITCLVILVLIRRYTGTMATVVEIEDIAGCRLGNEVVEGLADIGARRLRVVVVGVDEHLYVVLRESEPVN